MAGQLGAWFSPVAGKLNSKTGKLQFRAQRTARKLQIKLQRLPKRHNTPN